MPDAAELRRARRRAFVRVIAALVLLLAILVTVRLAGLTPSTDRIERFGDDLGTLGPVVFVLAGIALQCAFVPVPVIAGAAGLVFGTAQGTAIGVLVAGGAAGVQMLVGRRLAGKDARGLLGRRGQAAVDFIERRGFWAVLYLRLIPLMPFNMLNYAAGVCPLRVRDIFAGTTLGFAPRTFAYAALGGNITNLGSTEARVAIVLGLAMAAVGVVLGRSQIAAERRRA